MSFDVRDRTTDGLNKARLKLELKRSIRPALVIVAAAVLGVVLIGFVLLRVSPNTLHKTYRAQIGVQDATAVQPNVNEVRFKGVPVGKIKAARIKGDHPVLDVEIRRQYGRIYRDARAELRPNTPLQDMYLDIVDRGHKSAGLLKQNEVLPDSQTEMPVNIDDVLNMFKPTVRLRLRSLLDDLGNGMADRGRSLRAIFVQAAPFVETAGQLSGQLARRSELVRRLVRNTALLTGELGAHDTQLRTLVDQSATTLSTLSNGAGDLDATLRELPPTLTALRTSLHTVHGVLPDLNAAVKALYPVAKQLPARLSDLRRVNAVAAPAVHALRRPITKLVPFARTIRPLTSRLDRAVTALGPQVPAIDKVTTDLVSCKKGIQNFFQWNASISKFGDARGPIPRGNVVVGATSSGTLNDPGEVAPKSCAPGAPIGGRPATEKDKH